MTPKKQAKANPNPDREAEIERLKDEVPIPKPLLAFDKRTIEAFHRLHRRVLKWAETKTKEQIAGELAEALFEKRLWDREQIHLCDELARDRAERKFQKIHARAGKGYSFWEDVQAEWRAWQELPDKFLGQKGFAAAMERKYPGVTPGTLANKITAWKRESRNGDS